ncbi:SdpI family protein [Mycobacteroides abscessus]|uniref:SdpI family protein n=1 Tax=Mycobacteroides abscessus TaxID=36809 RepID=A0ABD7HG08_9MYCO|nr:sdpI/YhfL family protein [Mycobacteroides abscessus]PVA78031.1 sdpI/YhfL family protein [Mycobacteroides abscessus]PVB19492.1 sdpI/YhfL family protein [Mycobacteroides abscessus]PVB22508.1 sdpI/YhfL family protein [Mycobacteroides abscessus]PVB24233.1 sdpI/YhfL family protein [Mycobacteroides abscessus]
MTTRYGIDPENNMRAARTVSRVAVGVYLVAAATVVAGIAVGYAMARSQNLDPNLFFGLRTEVTLSSAAGWYASQKVAFSWLLFGAVPFLLLGAGAAVVALVKRWNPLWVLAITALPWLLLLGVGLLGLAQGEAAAENAIQHVNSAALASPPTSLLAIAGRG